MNCLDLNPDDHPLIAAPTGVGKSLMLCGIAQNYMEESGYDVLVLSHVKEILAQDYEALCQFFGKKDVGLYSAGLSKREVRNVTVAGIQSVYKKAGRFRDVGLVIIDEAHMINTEDEGMYRQFLNELEATYVGLTATHFRTAGGYIHQAKNGIFTKLVYNLTEPENYQRLVEEGYLSRMFMKGTKTKLDAKKEKVKVTGGDYNLKALSTAFDRIPVTRSAIKEIINTGRQAKRKHWLIFAIDIEHAEHIANELRSNGIETACIHSKMKENREQMIHNIKAGMYQAIVNVDVLTTGFDFPAIDMVCLLCPTRSPVKYIQMVGRGGRPEESKDYCLILDFGRVVERLGPIDNVRVKQPGQRGDGDPVMKECPECEGLQHAAVRECEFCGHEFEFKHNLTDEAADGQITSEPKWLDVVSVTYSIYKKPGKPDSLKVTYFCGLQSINEWVCPEHGGFATRLAKQWAQVRGVHPQLSAAGLLTQSQALREPKRIEVLNKGGYIQVEGYEF